MKRTYGLYVPAQGMPSGIHEGSAIVGEVAGDVVHVHYEGSKHMTFDERLLHAAGRREQSYPTVAQAWLPHDRLVLVGTVTRSEQLRIWVVDEITDPDTLVDWVGTLPVIGGSQKDRERAAGMAWSKLSPSAQMTIHARVAAGEDMTDLILAENVR